LTSSERTSRSQPASSGSEQLLAGADPGSGRTTRAATAARSTSTSRTVAGPRRPALQDLPGEELFGYLDDAGCERDVRSEDVNDYLRELAGQDSRSRISNVGGAYWRPASRRDRCRATDAETTRRQNAAIRRSSPTTSATRRPCAARRTSTRSCWTGFRAGTLEPTRARRAPGPVEGLRRPSRTCSACSPSGCYRSQSASSDRSTSTPTRPSMRRATRSPSTTTIVGASWDAEPLAEVRPAVDVDLSGAGTSGGCGGLQHLVDEAPCAATAGGRRPEEDQDRAHRRRNRRTCLVGAPPAFPKRVRARGRRGKIWPAKRMERTGYRGLTGAWSAQHGRARAQNLERWRNRARDLGDAAAVRARSTGGAVADRVREADLRERIEHVMERGDEVANDVARRLVLRCWSAGAVRPGRSGVLRRRRLHQTSCDRHPVMPHSRATRETVTRPSPPSRSDRASVEAPPGIADLDVDVAVDTLDQKADLATVGRRCVAQRRWRRAPRRRASGRTGRRRRCRRWSPRSRAPHGARRGRAARSAVRSARCRVQPSQARVPDRARGKRRSRLTSLPVLGYRLPNTFRKEETTAMTAVTIP